jgi:hypothetical protein
MRAELICLIFVDFPATYNIYRFMTGPDRPKPKPTPQPLARHSAKVLQLRLAIPSVQPGNLSASEALRIIRLLASDPDNVVTIKYADRRAKQRRITRTQIEKCVQKGTITEGPFLNSHGNWQVNIYRHAAGEEVTCVVAIEWATKVLVINAF